MKGTFWNERLSAEFALSESNFYDLQMSSPDPGSEPPGRNVTRNAAHQRVRAFEFSTRTVVTDNLRVGIMGALLDGVMVEFPHAVCTTAEFEAGTTTDPNAIGICRDLGTYTSID